MRPQGRAYRPGYQRETQVLLSSKDSGGGNPGEKQPPDRVPKTGGTQGRGGDPRVGVEEARKGSSRGDLHLYKENVARLCFHEPGKRGRVRKSIFKRGGGRGKAGTRFALKGVSEEGAKARRAEQPEVVVHLGAPKRRRKPIEGRVL